MMEENNIHKAPIWTGPVGFSVMSAGGIGKMLWAKGFLTGLTNLAWGSR